MTMKQSKNQLNKTGEHVIGLKGNIIMKGHQPT